MPEYLYHASPEANRESIRREGLRGMKGMFAVYMRGKTEVHHTDMSFEHPVHLAHWDPRQWVANFYEGPIDLWKVDVTGLVLYAGWDGPETYGVLGGIGPERLTRVIARNDQPNLPKPERDSYPNCEWQKELKI